MSDEKLTRIRHSLAHILAMAVKEHDPDVKLAIGPAIDDGFYYDFEFSVGREPKPEDLPKLTKRMRELVKKNLSFEGREIARGEALKFFADQPYKKELIEEFSAEEQKLTVSTSGDFIDLCRGGHVENTNEIDPRGFELSRIAGAYWRGDEKNKMLTRIYGLAFENEGALENYKTLREEAKKRDHKKLGPELDLFVFSELVGAGLPLWTPKGTLVRNLLDNFVWELRKKRGFVQVDIPHITKKDLYEKSGHWDKFKDELFKITTREGHLFAMKPMNCPHHTQIFDRRPHSYRDMPQRYANTTKVYRDEQSGELAGLSRVRAITQDDAHVFCRESQIKDEVFSIWDIIEEFYGAFGFSLRVRLSLHDLQHPEKYLGTAETWKTAEDMLRTLVRERGVETTEAVGEAALYGPKIDFLGKDALGREHQVATIQLDMNLPERFDLACINEKGVRERIVMIHCAIMGSLERFLSVLIEHTGGAFPAWLSPLQTVVLPVSEKYNDYGKTVTDELLKNGIRTELRDENESLGKKIRNAKLQKIPYVLVVGEKEVVAHTVTVESRDEGAKGTLLLQEFLALINNQPDCSTRGDLS